jgi:hypothetical protein
MSDDRTKADKAWEARQEVACYRGTFSVNFLPSWFCDLIAKTG